VPLLPVPILPKIVAKYPHLNFDMLKVFFSTFNYTSSLTFNKPQYII